MARPDRDLAGALADPDPLLRRERWLIGLCLALAAGLAWWWLLGQAADMRSAAAMAAMPGMAAAEPPRFWSYVPPAALMWSLMMVAMMLPSVTPMVLLYARFAGQAAPRRGVLAPTTALAGAYLLVWGGFSAAAALAQFALVKLGAVSATALTLGDRRVAAALLLAAGAYQLSPAKDYCLKACRAPLFFIMRLWRPGWRGAARIGLHHGLHCLGCCWLVMALLFVGGVMSLVWIAALAVLVLAEKVSPLGGWVARAAGVVALTAGAALLAPGVVHWPAS